MLRIRLVDDDSLTADQRAVCDAAKAGKRGAVPLPLRAWLHSPEFASRAQRLGEYVRYDTTLAPRLSELAILIVARHWTAQHEWSAHKREALRAGVAEQSIAAIANRERPTAAPADELLVHDFAYELITLHSVSDELYAQAAALLGERGVVELLGILGYYTLVAMTLNALQIESGDRKLLAD